MADENRSVSAAIVVVSLRWNGEPLVTGAARSGEDVVLGDAKDALAPLPEAALGRAALSIADARGGPHVRVPEGKVASIAGTAGTRLVAGPARVALAAGEEAKLVLGAFEVSVAAHAKEAVKRGRRVAAGAWLHTAMVAAVHAGLLFAGSRAALAHAIEEAPEAEVDQLRGYLAAAEERSSARDTVKLDDRGDQDEKQANGRDGNGEKGGGERHEGASGKAGSTASRAVGRRWGAPRRDADGMASPAADDLETARAFGLVGVLEAQSAAVRRMEGASPWGANDPFAAMGGMLGRVVGESSGTGGLALSGVGEGGGGRGDGIGLGTIGALGHTDGAPGLGTGGAGTKQMGIGFGSWGGSWSHFGRFPSRTRGIRWVGDWGHSVTGRLPPEAVQRVVRANFGRFRACYQEGLRRNPALTGRVAARFVIGRDGAVSHVGDQGSDLPDAGVRSCVLRAFYGLSFPQPEGGIVTVVYPVSFTTVMDQR